jgi:hypothetical protein
MPKSLDADRSRELAKAANCRTRAPFDNAYSAIALEPEALYVQGFLVCEGEPFQPVEHAWLELGERVIDPNFPSLKRSPTAVFYFPAQQLSYDDLKAAIEEAKEDYPEDDPLPIYGSMPYDYYGDVMLGGAAYTAAFAAAKAKCKELNPLKPKTASGG